MSEELLDEVEAINSIYGDESLVLADEEGGSGTATSSSTSSRYILSLPAGASSLRLEFPASYPLEPPSVLGTQHSSGGVRGAGARDKALFAEVLREVFDVGAVCLFDAVEEFGRRVQDHDDDNGDDDGIQKDEDDEDEQAKQQQQQQDDAGAGNVKSTATPTWSVSTPFIENRSTFIAHATGGVTSVSQARAFVAHLLASDKRIRSATHNMTAWRIRGSVAGTSYQDCDDDGETAAGSRLLHLLQLMGLWDVLVVVTRWYGGVKLGPRRFAIINAAARDALVRAGLVGGGDNNSKGDEKDKEKEKEKNKGR
ncbi:hypothetical protein RJ55_05367 [Drechmeria coniospora]|nr:hypothetical protein RJ55_05367 [Drechmeria coniospora]